MKNTLMGGLFALLAAVIAVFLTHYLGKENIDIRYTLSDSIPAKFLGKGSLSNIQQLDIVNKGDKPAEKIRIKLTKKIVQYELTKYSEMDKVDENLSNGTLEILYPELPPERKIKIVFSSEIFPLKKEDVYIYHSKGQGKEAFDEKSSFIFSPKTFFAFYMLLFICFFMIEVFYFRNRWLERDADRGDKEIFTRKKSPLLLSVDQWDKIRKEAIENYIRKSWFDIRNIEDSNIVISLNSEKPEYLKDHEWELLIKEAQDAFVKKVPLLMDSLFYYERNIEKFFKINKPKHFQQNKWDEIIKRLHELYVFSLREALVNNLLFENASNIYKKIKNENIYSIKDKYWNDYINFLKNVYLFSLLNGICHQRDNFVSYVSQHNLNVLDDSDSDFVKDVAYKFQYNSNKKFHISLDSAKKFLESDKEEWLEEKDYNELKEMAKEVVFLYEEKAKIRSIRNLLDQIRNRQSLLEEKPCELNDEEWGELKKLEKDLVGLQAEHKEIFSKNEKVLTEINEKEKSIPILIETLNFQLSTINEFLTDYTVLDRIEDYNNKFSSGNFQNLKRIAAHLKKLEKV